MGALRTKMIDEMRLRNFSPRTEQSYVSAMVGLVKHYRQSPDQLTQEQIRTYLLHLKERGLSPSSRNVAISGMKFFYHQILGWDEQKLFLPPRKGSWRLPEVFSPKEVERLLCAHGKLRDRCLLMTAYATGLRESGAGGQICSWLFTVDWGKCLFRKGSLYLAQPRTTQSRKPAFSARARPPTARSTNSSMNSMRTVRCNSMKLRIDLVPNEGGNVDQRSRAL